MMRKTRRVVITGLGVVAPNGIGKDTFWQNLIAGKSAVDWITAFDPTPFPCRIAAEVKNFRPEEFMARRRAKEIWRFSQFAVASARMALEDAKFEITPANCHQVAACFGTCINGFEKIEESHLTFLTKGFRSLDPLTCLEYSTHAPVSHVSIELGIKGPTMTLASGCSTGLDVIKWGYDQIRTGTANAVVAGSTEAPLVPLAFATFCAIEGLSRRNDAPTKASRPYDLNRDGLVLGEGGGAVVLEPLDSALDRGASIYAEVLGYGIASEAVHLRKVDPSGQALAKAIQHALSDAELSIDNIDYINAHGNSLPDYDLAETNAFKRAFGDRAYSIPVSSIKSMIGQPLAASGTLQAIATALTIRHGVIPPTINYETPDPDCDLDYVPNRSRVARVQRALANAHSMGGTHSVIILGRPGI